MRILKMTLGTLSLLIFVVCFSTAAPMVQQKKTPPLEETITPPSQAQKKLNFIQKFILKKAQKKVNKASDESQYRKMAVWSLALGLLAHPICYGMFFLGISFPPLVYLAVISWVVFLALVFVSGLIGAMAIRKTNSKRTRNIAIAGVASALVSLIVFAIITLHIFNNTQF